MVSITSLKPLNMKFLVILKITAAKAYQEYWQAFIVNKTKEHFKSTQIYLAANFAAFESGSKFET